MRPIQGPLRQTIGIPAQDGSNKEASYVQSPAPQPESPERSEVSKKHSLGEARLQSDLRAAELNAAFKGEILGIEPVLQSGDSNFFLPEVNDEVLIKK